MVKTKNPLDNVNIKDNPNQLVAYANINRITMTPEEAIFHFGLRSQENAMEADGVAKIYLSLPHAKRIAIVLAQILTEYEAMFGEVLPEFEMRLTEEGRKRIEESEKANVSDRK